MHTSSGRPSSLLLLLPLVVVLAPLFAVLARVLLLLLPADACVT
jgi:hypothetical protein